jgi:HPt (histidine-containing phosphotransfer) domain-containing protein
VDDMGKVEDSVAMLCEELEMDESDLLELYKKFVVEMQEGADLLTELMGKNDYEELKKLMHNLKGVYANLKVMEVHQLALEIEKCIKEDHLSEVIKQCEFLLDRILFYRKGIIAHFLTKGLEL